MRLLLTRDGVCQGDDAVAHERMIVLRDGLPLERIVAAILEADYLPAIMGGRATWSLASRIPIAVIAQHRRRPRMLGSIPRKLTDLDYHDDTLRCHLGYLAQASPRAVARILSYPLTVEAVLRDSRESGEERISLTEVVTRFKGRKKLLPRVEEINEALERIDWIEEERDGGELFFRFSPALPGVHAEVGGEDYFWEESVWRTRGWGEGEVDGRAGFSVFSFWVWRVLDRILP